MHQRAGLISPSKGQCDGVVGCGDKRSSLLCAMPAVAMMGRHMILAYGNSQLVLLVFQPAHWFCEK